MKSKLKNMAISFILMIVVYISFSSKVFFEYGISNPHVGLLYFLGLVFGPYGALGATLGNIVLDLMTGHDPIDILPSALITFGVSYLAYKLWYSGFKTEKITKPRLDNIYQLNLFLSNIVICGFIYSAVHATLIGLFFSPKLDEYAFISYLLNFINIAFISGVLGVWLSKRIDFIEIPKKSKRKVNRRLYQIIFNLLAVVTIIAELNLFISPNQTILAIDIVLIGILLFAYLTKPFEYDVEPNEENTIIEKILQNFLIIILGIALLGIIISIFSYNYLVGLNQINQYIVLMPALIITDVILILFFVPSILILKYIENNVIKPISSFSEIKSFIGENKKIESEGLVNIYSKYINEQNEIGTLARSYTDLINFNNHYIENIDKIEGERKRIETELDIATKIQAANLPTEAIETDEFIVNGYSHPAKEVGGDFFDYYILDDDHLALVIGDASGKGVPAAILSMNTQVLIKQLLKYNQDPSKILYQLNNQLCENNSETMFITLWLGIYNKSTNELIFSNAGHNPPLIRENDKFKYLDIDSGIVIGVMEDFDYITENIKITDKLVLYTDGITDANNKDKKMYGEDRLLNFFNEFKSDADPIDPLLDDINSFTKDEEQFDDMTLLYLKIK